MTNNTNPYSQEPIIKQWVDECTGKFIYPITSTDAVITKHNKTLTEVLDLIFGNLRQDKDTLSDLKIRVEDLENYKNQFIALKSAFDSIKYQIDNGTFATRTDLECLRNQLNTILESIKIQLQTNTNLFTQLLNYLISGQTSGNVQIGDLTGFLRTSELLSSIKALNAFVENIKSELTGDTYPQTNGSVLLPPTVGGTLYVADNANSNNRFHFSLNCDVNGDGAVTAADITALYSFILQNNSSQIVHGDVTGDGLITAADITKVYSVLLNGREPIVHDKVTNKNYTLPSGIVFVNNDNVYCVTSENKTKLIGKLYNPNSTFTNIAQLAPQQSTLYTPPQYGSVTLENSEKEIIQHNICQVFDNSKVINVYVVALQGTNDAMSLEERIQAINASITSGSNVSYVSDYTGTAINSVWEGIPQDYAQGIVYLKDFWNTIEEIQYVQPLGSFIDFKRFVNNTYQNYIDVSMVGSDNKFNGVLTRFNVISAPATVNNKFTDKEDSIILAEYVPETGTAYYFLWNGLSNKKPVIIQKSKLAEYLTYINY